MKRSDLQGFLDNIDAQRQSLEQIRLVVIDAALRAEVERAISLNQDLETWAVGWRNLLSD